jgi:hypothetical protein
MSHYFVPTAEDLASLGSARTEFFETFFDTPEHALEQQRSMLLVLTDTVGQRGVVWHLGTLSPQDPSVLTPFLVGEPLVLAHLKEILPAPENVVNPASYCRRPQAVIRTRRYTLPSKDFVDVCYFHENVIYTVGVSTACRLDRARAPSRYAAYTGKTVSAFMYTTEDPVRHDPFLPLPWGGSGE